MNIVVLSLFYPSHLDIIIDSTVISWLVDSRWMNSLWNLKKTQSFKIFFQLKRIYWIRFSTKSSHQKIISRKIGHIMWERIEDKQQNVKCNWIMPFGNRFADLYFSKIKSSRFYFRHLYDCQKYLFLMLR